MLQVWPSPSRTGVLKNVWSDVRELLDDFRLEVISLTPRNVPGRNIMVKKVMTCIDAESRAVCLVTISILLAESSILLEVSWLLSAKSLLISMLYD